MIADLLKRGVRGERNAIIQCAIADKIELIGILTACQTKHCDNDHRPHHKSPLSRKRIVDS